MCILIISSVFFSIPMWGKDKESVAAPVPLAELPPSLQLLTTKINLLHETSPPLKINNSVPDLSVLTQFVLDIFPPQVVLLKNSHALIGATPQNPRPLFWSEKEAVILTLKIHSESSGPNDIEAFFFDQKAKRNRLVRITEESIRNGTGQWEEPAECLTCHGPAARPIWSEYPVWPEALGEDDDRLNEFDRTWWNRNDSPAMSKIRERLDLQNYFRPYEDLDLGQDTYLHKRPSMRIGVLMTQLHAQSLYYAHWAAASAQEKSRLLYYLLSCDPFDKEFLPKIFQEKNLTWADFDISKRHDLAAKESTLKTWNEYYHDGAADTKEYLAALVYQDLQRNHPQVLSLYPLQSMQTKYPLSSPWNKQMAEKVILNLSIWGSWIPIKFKATARTELQRRHLLSSEHKQAQSLLCRELSSVPQSSGRTLDHMESN